MKRTALTLVITLLFFLTANSQVQMKKIEIKGDGIFLLHELGAVIADQDDMVTVKTLLPQEMRPKENKDIEIYEGDTIIMFNQEKVKNATEMEKQYSALAMNDAVSIGLRRDNQMYMLDFKKMDANAMEKGGKRMMIIKDNNVPDDTPKEEKVMIKNPDNIVLLSKEGLILEEKDNSLCVVDVMPHAKTILGNSLIKPGCKLVSINDKQATDKEQFDSVYNALQTGDSITLVFSTKSDTKKVEYEKPEPQEIKIIKK